MKLLTILIILITIAVLIRGSKKHDYISTNDTVSYKFYLSILILFHHLALQTDLFGFREFRHWGSIIVGNFLFISGYGLMYSYEKKGEKYFQNFFSKRLLKIYVPFFIATALYTALSYLEIYQKYDWKNIINLTFTNAITPLPYSWYVIFITIWYIAFYISFKFFHKYGGGALLLLINTIYLYIGIKFMGWGWWTPTLAFSIGTIYLKTQEQLSTRILIIITVMILLLLQIKSYPVNIYISIIYIPLLCIWAFEVIKRININSQLVNYISKYSYEIYLTQGFSIYFFRNIITNDLFYIIICLLTTILLANILNRVSSRIYNSLVQK